MKKYEKKTSDIHKKYGINTTKDLGKYQGL